MASTVAALASRADRRGDATDLVTVNCAAVSHRKHGPPLKVNEEQPTASGVPERALAVLSAGTGDLLGFRHIHPPSTIQRCAVQERESSAASHNKIRATSSGYSLCGRHWLRRIESSASGVTQ